MKIYVLLESCCNHFTGVYSEKEYQDLKWEDAEEANDYIWKVYEIKGEEWYPLEYLPTIKKEGAVAE